MAVRSRTSVEYYCYRDGAVEKGSRHLKFACLLLAAYICSLPQTTSAAALAFDFALLPLINSHWLVAFVAFPVFVGLSTAFAYHYHALALDRRAQELWSTEEGRALTKIQPKRSISKDLRAEAVHLGNVNAFLTGVLGSGLLVVHILVYPWARVRLGVLTFPEFVKDTLISYIWIDFSAYWLHRLLHTRSLYFLHKSHHKYNVPIAHAAFAANPIDFLVFQILGMMILALVPLHPLAFVFAAVPTAYHNQVEHSGISFSGEQPWTPSAKFHDDHHSQYTCNFGFETILWDWGFGTLRKKKRTYREDTHHDKIF